MQRFEGRVERGGFEFRHRNFLRTRRNRNDYRAARRHFGPRSRKLSNDLAELSDIGHKLNGDAVTQRLQSVESRILVHADDIGNLIGYTCTHIQCDFRSGFYFLTSHGTLLDHFTSRNGLVCALDNRDVKAEPQQVPFGICHTLPGYGRERNQLNGNGCTVVVDLVHKGDDQIAQNQNQNTQPEQQTACSLPVIFATRFGSIGVIATLAIHRATAWIGWDRSLLNRNSSTSRWSCRPLDSSRRCCRAPRRGRSSGPGRRRRSRNIGRAA